MTIHSLTHLIDPSPRDTTEQHHPSSTHGSPHSTPPNRSMVHHRTFNTTPQSTISSYDNSIPLAERRKTQVSNYLVSQDFKTDFAIKLNHLRQRELNSPANTSTHNHHHTHNDTTTNPFASTNQDNKINSPRGHFDDPSMITPPNSRTKSSFRSSDLNSLKEEPENEDYSSASSNQKEILSCRSSIRASEDPEEQNARYEVIRKLADQLAEQIEENDHLLYELGVVRSNNARLQSVGMDHEDTLTCLNQRIRHLESVIATTNNNNNNNNNTRHSSTSQSIPGENPSKLHHNHSTIKSSNEIQSLKSQLKQVRNALSEMQLGLNPSMNLRNHHLIRHSWPSAQPKTAWTNPVHQQTYQNGPIHSFTESFCSSSFANDEKDLNFLHKIHQLEVELFECQEARITSGVTLQRLINSIDEACDSYGLESEKERDTAKTVETNLNGKEGSLTACQGLEDLPSHTSDAHMSHFGSSLINHDNPTNEEPVRPASISSTEGRQTNDPTSVSSSPLMSLASFGFSGWGRKLPNSSSLPKAASDNKEARKIPSRAMTMVDHDQLQQHHQNSTPLSATIIEEPSNTTKTFGLRYLFSYNNNNNPTAAQTIMINEKSPSNFS